MPVLDADGTDIHYQLEGDDHLPVLMFSNSLGTSLEMWEDQVPAVTGRYRVLRYDNRGHGRSGPAGDTTSIGRLGRDALALLDALELPQVDYCGLSLGGMVGLWLAANQPGRVRRAVLACTAAHLPPTDMWLERAAMVREGGMEAVHEAVLGRWFTPAFRARDPQAVQRIERMLLATSPGGYAACCEAIAYMDLREDLERIDVPVRIIAADRDPSTPPEHARLMHDRVAGSELVILQDVAHLANVEAGERFNGLLESFLEG